MMTDLVERLRRLYVQNGTNYVQEAADEIQKLRAELQYARDGLTKGRTRMREDIDAMRAHIIELQENGDRLREIADAAVRDQREMIDAVAGPLRDEISRLRDALSCKPADDNSEPVAWVKLDDVLGRTDIVTALRKKAGPLTYAQYDIPLYAAPPQRHPLSEDEVIELAVRYELGHSMRPIGLQTGLVFATERGYKTSELLDFARAVEAAHGIKEETK